MGKKLLFFRYGGYPTPSYPIFKKEAPKVPWS